MAAVGVIAVGITWIGSRDGVSAVEPPQPIQEQVSSVPEVRLVPPAEATAVKVSPPAVTTPIETQVAEERSVLPAVPGIASDMSSIELSEIASAVESLGIRAEQLDEALPQAELPQKELAPQVQEPVAVAAETAAKQAPSRAMSTEDAEVHKKLVARLEDVRARGDANGVKAAKAELDMFEATLATAIEFRIIDRNGEKPGFWRTLVDDAKTKQFFVVVEAVVDGKAVNWAVRDADTGEVVSGARFGLRVAEKTFADLSADKKEDGRIDNMVVGLKPVGRITPVWSIKTDGETITEF